MKPEEKDLISQAINDIKPLMQGDIVNEQMFALVRAWFYGYNARAKEAQK